MTLKDQMEGAIPAEKGIHLAALFECDIAATLEQLVVEGKVVADSNGEGIWVRRVHQPRQKLIQISTPH